MAVKVCTSPIKFNSLQTELLHLNAYNCQLATTWIPLTDSLALLTDAPSKKQSAQKLYDANYSQRGFTLE